MLAAVSEGCSVPLHYWSLTPLGHPIFSNCNLSEGMALLFCLLLGLQRSVGAVTEVQWLELEGLAPAVGSDTQGSSAFSLLHSQSFSENVSLWFRFMCESCLKPDTETLLKSAAASVPHQSQIWLRGGIDQICPLFSLSFLTHFGVF